MTIENSPRATSAAPARARPARPIPARRAAHHPVTIFVSAVTTASAAAGTMTPPGSWVVRTSGVAMAR
jgi:hypothetical protein